MTRGPALGSLPNGPGAAAILAAGGGSLALGISSLAADARSLRCSAHSSSGLRPGRCPAWR